MYLIQQAKENPINITASPPHDKFSVLDKPRVMPANNLGDGVLPKPLDMKNDDQINNDLDAAAEVIDTKRRSKPVIDPLVNNMVDRYAKMRNNLLNEDLKVNPVPVMGVPVNQHPQEQENHPQMVAPNFENVEEKDDHAGERGEDGNQVGGFVLN